VLFFLVKKSNNNNKYRKREDLVYVNALAAALFAIATKN
jgi:hypothetical protein